MARVFASDYWPMVGAVHRTALAIGVNCPTALARRYIDQEIKSPGEFPHQGAWFLLFALLALAHFICCRLAHSGGIVYFRRSAASHPACAKHAGHYFSL
jgi:hypothetical protein